MPLNATKYENKKTDAYFWPSLPIVSFAQGHCVAGGPGGSRGALENRFHFHFYKEAPGARMRDLSLNDTMQGHPDSVRVNKPREGAPGEAVVPFHRRTSGARTGSSPPLPGSPVQPQWDHYPTKKR